MIIDYTHKILYNVDVFYKYLTKTNMENRKYLSLESFGMFITGLVVGILVILAVMLSHRLNVGEDGQTQLLRSNTRQTTQEAVRGVNPSFTTSGNEAVSGINPSYTTSTEKLSGINPSYTTSTEKVSGINPSY